MDAVSQWTCNDWLTDSHWAVDNTFNGCKNRPSDAITVSLKWHRQRRHCARVTVSIFLFQLRLDRSNWRCSSVTTTHCEWTLYPWPLTSSYTSYCAGSRPRSPMATSTATRCTQRPLVVVHGARCRWQGPWENTRSTTSLHNASTTSRYVLTFCLKSTFHFYEKCSQG